MEMSEPQYGEAVARAILEVAADDMVGSIFRIDGRGVWIDDPVSTFHAWHPAMSIDAPGSPDPLSEPSLPFPFTARQLAAFALSGMGRFVADAFFGDGPLFWTGDGPWGNSIEQRDDMLGRLPTRGIKAREALIEARKAYEAAATFVRPPSVGSSFEAGQEDEQGRRELARWRRDMCQALLRPQASGSRLSADSGRAAPPRPPRQQPHQEAAILAKLAELGIDAQALPPVPKGKPSKEKQAVMAALGYEPEVMKKAWQRLLNAERDKAGTGIRYAEP